MPSIFYTLLGEGAEENASILGREERQVYDGLRYDNRRREWWLGRAASKKLLAGLKFEWEQGLQVLNEAQGGPYAVDNGGQRLPGCLSISHRKDWAAAAWCDWGNIGLDLEYLEPRVSGFRQDYFTQAENEWLENLDTEYVMIATNLVWSLKESVLKAMRIGLSVDTRQINILPVRELRGVQWSQVEIIASKRARAWWRRLGEYVLSVAIISDENITGPISLEEIV